MTNFINGDQQKLTPSIALTEQLNNFYIPRYTLVSVGDSEVCTLEFKPRYFPRKEDWQGFGRLCINRIRRHSPGTASKQE
jgi:hypothetical protein